MQYQKLNNGVMMPMLGYGTFQIPPLQTEKCILHALESGYRLIDSAAAYLNEKEIGKCTALCSNGYRTSCWVRKIR